MSVDVCQRCDAYVDTDIDCDCYVPDPRHSLKGDICICERCREKEEEEKDLDVA